MHSYQLIFYIDASRIKFYKRSFIIYENTENIGIGRFEKYTYISAVIYRISQFQKRHLFVYIGIGQYEKKLIGHTLHNTTYIILPKSNEYFLHVLSYCSGIF